MAMVDIFIPINNIGNIRGKPKIEIKTPELLSPLAIAEAKEKTIDNPNETNAKSPKKIKYLVTGLKVKYLNSPKVSIPITNKSRKLYSILLMITLYGSSRL